MRVEADVVYVIPPNRDMTTASGVPHLAPSAQPRGMRLPIDLLLCSLASDLGELTLGVVLSGTGHTAPWACRPSARTAA